MRNKKPVILVALFLTLSALIAGCGSVSNANEPGVANYELAPLAGMPLEVQSAPVTVKQAYQFAVANQEILSQWLVLHVR